MIQKFLGFGVIVFFILGIAFPSFVWSNATVITMIECKVQVKIDEIHLSSDGGATWSDNLLSSPSEYITVEQGSSTSIFSYFAQNVQVSAGTYNRVKVVLNPVMRIWWNANVNPPDAPYWSQGNTTPFAQAVGQNTFDGANVVDNVGASGYWYMTLTSPSGTIEQVLNLTIAEGQTSTISVEIYNNFDVTGEGLADDYVTSDANPSTSTLIVVE